ncbi:MAG: hypothetical protein QOC87_40 [Actinomycetota bacterium]|nr:hypothetical protein [Actinomycetota bacterium]
MTIGRIVRIVWASPASVLGLLLCLFFDTRRVDNGILIAEGARWPQRLGWHYSAITFGHVVLAVGHLDEPTSSHERAHVRQYEAWGPFFLPAYVLASLATVVRGRHAYRDNPFEVAARTHTRHFE